VARKIIWTETAAHQRKEVLQYWKHRNKSNAYPKKLIKIINDRLHLLSEYPFLGRKTNHKDLREHTLGNYSIFFKVTPNRIIVAIFWDNRRNPKELLEQLKKLNR
jgi:toxin YoeB